MDYRNNNIGPNITPNQPENRGTNFDIVAPQPTPDETRSLGGNVIRATVESAEYTPNSIVPETPRFEAAPKPLGEIVNIEPTPTTPEKEENPGVEIINFETIRNDDKDRLPDAVVSGIDTHIIKFEQTGNASELDEFVKKLREKYSENIRNKGLAA